MRDEEDNCFDFDLDFDFDLEEDSQINSLKKRVKFDLEASSRKVQSFVLPAEGECIRLISPAGGFSSCSVAMAIARQTKIKNIFISTLRVGKKEALALERLNIPDVQIVCGGIALANAEKYDYAKFLENIANENGWRISYKRNHSKVILIDSDAGKIVIETSSNFNENPQVEQFCITNDKDVYFWYVDELKKNEMYV